MHPPYIVGSRVRSAEEYEPTRLFSVHRGHYGAAGPLSDDNSTSCFNRIGWSPRKVVGPSVYGPISGEFEASAKYHLPSTRARNQYGSHGSKPGTRPAGSQSELTPSLGDRYSASLKSGHSPSGESSGNAVNSNTHGQSGSFVSPRVTRTAGNSSGTASPRRVTPTSQPGRSSESSRSSSSVDTTRDTTMSKRSHTGHPRHRPQRRYYFLTWREATRGRRPQVR